MSHSHRQSRAPPFQICAVPPPRRRPRPLLRHGDAVLRRRRRDAGRRRVRDCGAALSRCRCAIASARPAQSDVSAGRGLTGDCDRRSASHRPASARSRATSMCRRSPPATRSSWPRRVSPHHSSKACPNFRDDRARCWRPSAASTRSRSARRRIGPPRTDRPRRARARPPRPDREAARRDAQRSRNACRWPDAPDVDLFATWHSREAAGVEPARRWLAGRRSAVSNARGRRTCASGIRARRGSGSRGSACSIPASTRSRSSPVSCPRRSSSVPPSCAFP